MNTYRIFHLTPARDKTDGALLDALQATFGNPDGAIGRGLYREVAKLQAEDLEAAYRLTNRAGDDSWSEEPGIMAAEKDARSTSAGDLILDVDNWVVSLCLTRSWAELSDDLTSAFMAQLGNGIAELERSEEMAVPDAP